MTRDYMIVMTKDFETATLSQVKLLKGSGDNWNSEDGEFSTNFTEPDASAAGESLVRISKK